MSLVVVHDLDVVGSRGCPHKTDPILIVDADTVLASTIPRQSFQSVAWRHAQIFERRRRIQLIEFADRDPPETLGTRTTSRLGSATVEDVGSPSVPKGPNHDNPIARISCYVKSLLGALSA
jgi:hypothetical protein